MGEGDKSTDSTIFILCAECYWQHVQECKVSRGSEGALGVYVTENLFSASYSLPSIVSLRWLYIRWIYGYPNGI